MSKVSQKKPEKFKSLYSHCLKKRHTHEPQHKAHNIEAYYTYTMLSFSTSKMASAKPKGPPKPIHYWGSASDKTAVNGIDDDDELKEDKINPGATEYGTKVGRSRTTG